MWCFWNSVVFLNREHEAYSLKHEDRLHLQKGTAKGPVLSSWGDSPPRSGISTHQLTVWPRRNPPIGKLLKAFTGDGPFCSSGVVWGRTFSRKDFMAGWWSDCCWDGGVCCFTNRFGSSWRDCCIICCCTLRGRPLKWQNNWEKLWRLSRYPHISLHFFTHFPLLERCRVTLYQLV